MRTIALGTMLAIGTAAGAGDLQAQGAPAPAATPSHLCDRLQLSLSGTNVWLGSNIWIDPASRSPGTEVDPGDLGASNTSIEPRFALRWRPGHRHEIEVG